MSFFENTRKPVGFSGKIMVAMMNFGHSAMAAWGLHFLQLAPDAMVLDCGCGGGANIKTLLKLCPKGKVQGIDYSAVSVEKARKVNAGAIAAGQCTVQQASVAELPFEAEQFDVVTAFETVYFWPELAQNFREVYQVLKPGGRMYMVHRPHRLIEILGTMKQYKLEPKRMKMVHPFKDKDANMVLIEAVRGGGAWMKVEAPVIVYKEPGVYTDEIYSIYGY